MRHWALRHWSGCVSANSVSLKPKTKDTRVIALAPQLFLQIGEKVNK